MAHLSAKLDLTKIQGSFRQQFNYPNGQSKECLCIPVDALGLYNAVSGSLYADIVLIERKEVGKYGDTHMVKLSVPKAVDDTLTQEQKNALIIGNAKPFGQSAAAAPAPAPAPVPSPAYGMGAPVAPAQPAPSAQPFGNGNPNAQNSEIPF